MKNERTGVIREYDMHSASVRALYGVILFFCGVMVVLAVFPLLWVVLAGFKDLKEFVSSTSIVPQSFSLQPFATTWNQLGIAKNYLNSLIFVVGSVICALIFNGLLGYGIGILKPKGHKAVKRLVMLSLLMPTTISIVPLFMNIQNLGLGNSFLPLWLSYGANAMYVILFVQFFESLPLSIIEASRIDGCSQLQTEAHLLGHRHLCRQRRLVGLSAALSGAAGRQSANRHGAPVRVQHRADRQRRHHDALGGVLHDPAHHPVLHLPEAADGKRGVGGH